MTSQVFQSDARSSRPTSRTAAKTAKAHSLGKLPLRWGIHCVLALSFLASCVPTISKMPDQNYLGERSLEGISRVAVVVSTNDVEVSYSQAVDFSSSILPLDLLVQAGKSSADLEKAKDIRARVNPDAIKDALAQSFIQPINKAACFQRIEYVADEDGGKQEVSGGYDAVVKLTINKVLLERVAGGDARLGVDVRGEMEVLSSGKNIWTRQEIVQSSEPVSLEECRSNGLRELVPMLETAGKRLAYDFAYSH